MNSFSVNGQLLNSVQELFNITALVVVPVLTIEDFIIYGSDKGDVCIRCSGTFEKIQSYSLNSISPVLCLTVTQDFKHVLIGCLDGEIAILSN